MFLQTSSQSDLFDAVAAPLVKEAFLGFNCTLFSYGQTGSGKTHTLQGKHDSSDTWGGVDRGIVPRVAQSMFAHIDELYLQNNGNDENSNNNGNSVTDMKHGAGEEEEGQEQRNKNDGPEIICEVKLSVMEIYQERLRDLLSPDTTATNAAMASSTWNQANGGDSNNRINLRIREHVGGSVWVEGALCVVCCVLCPPCSVCI